MKYQKFENLGGKYPYCLEARFNHVLNMIDTLWDTPEIDDYFSDLIIDKRGGRQGFPNDAMDEILMLRSLRELETLRRAESSNDAIQLLKSRGISLNKSEFFKALINGEKEIIDLFIRSTFNIHIKDDQGIPPIIIAMKKGYTVIASILLNAGSDINAYDKMGITPLMIACGKPTQSYKELAELLINKGAIINVRDKLGYTPLLLSLSGGNSEIAELLIEKGADVFAQTRNRENALSLAEKLGNTRIIELLLNKLNQRSQLSI